VKIADKGLQWISDIIEARGTITIHYDAELCVDSSVRPISFFAKVNKLVY